jgi:hypothetical protein
MRPAEPRVETTPIALTVQTTRHGVITIQATMTSINEFTYYIDAPQFPGAGAASESAAEVIEFTTDNLSTLLDRRSASYWRRRGIL